MGENYIQKLGLGTVQFGIDYGVSNQSGQTSQDEAQKILHIAAQENTTAIDTAHLYGNSEEVLGNTFPTPCPFNLVTKTLAFRTDKIEQQQCDAFNKAIALSLSRLKQKKIYGLLMHHADDLKAENGNALFQIMQDYKERGLISKIGVSVYDGDQIDQILEKFDIDLIQIPLNIFDQRLIDSDHLKRLKDKNIEIHVRSAFLQGITFMEPRHLPDQLIGLKEPLTGLGHAVQSTGISKTEAALAFLMNRPEIDQVICGVNTADQFQTLCKTVKNLPNLPIEFFKPFAVNDPLLVNPANWA